MKNLLQIYFHSIPRKEHVPNVEDLVELFPLMSSKVIPDERLTISQNAVRAFSGKVFRHCQDDLIDFCKKGKLDPHKPIEDFSSQELRSLMEWRSRL